MTTGAVTIMPADADIFVSGCDALVNPVDCTGAMGKGLALSFRQRYHAACAAYRGASRRGMMPGLMRAVHANDDIWILFVATKDHWRGASRLNWVKSGLDEIEHFVLLHQVEHTIRSVAIPALGCGLGGLRWDDVLPLEMAAAERMEAAGVRVLLYPPHEAARRHR